MSTRDKEIEIAVDDQRIVGTLVAPSTIVPGVLYVHGWGASQEQYISRAREIAALGCVCLTFDLRGHARDSDQYETVTREDNLRDVVAAYDVLAEQPLVDRSAIAVVGASYGAYLSAILTSLRPVRWLALRVPALYKDEDWATPKQQLNKHDLAVYRRGAVSKEDNRALRACAAFKGDVLIVESERDDTVPHPVIANYIEAFEQAHSMTYRIIADADHALSEQRWQQAYSAILLNWATEMVIGAREEGSAPNALSHLRPGPRRQRTPAEG